MKKKCVRLLMTFGICVSASLQTAHAATITYTYDAQHRLVQASYSASQKEFFNHDAAGNVDQRVAITDAKYLESWLLYFSLLRRATEGTAMLGVAPFPGNAIAWLFDPIKTMESQTRLL